MLTSLVLYGRSVDAVEVLSMMQQAWPGITAPAGGGTMRNPWVCTTPAQWFGAAKELAKKNRASTAGKVWVKAGGRLLGIAVNNFYVSDYGVVPAVAPIVATDPAVKHEDPTYPKILELIGSESAGGIRNAEVAVAIRNILGGQAWAGATILPCLTVVLFIAEVARNHTAFHTNLMLLDLVQKSVKLSDEGAPAVTYQWANVLWQTGQIDANVTLILNALKERFQSLYKASKAKAELKMTTKKASPLDETAQFTASFEGGEKSLSGGISPMAHTGSVRGSAFDLTGVGTHRFVKGGSTSDVPSFSQKSQFTQWQKEVDEGIADLEKEELRIQGLRPPPADKREQITEIVRSKAEMVKGKAAMIEMAKALAANERFAALTLVRRKEATIAIRWLSEKLDGAGANAKSKVQGTATAYDFVTGMAKAASENTETGAKEIVGSKIMFEIQRRVGTFELMIA
jgi:hypothetical protein